MKIRIRAVGQVRGSSETKACFPRCVVLASHRRALPPVSRHHLRRMLTAAGLPNGQITSVLRSRVELWSENIPFYGNRNRAHNSAHPVPNPTDVSRSSRYVGSGMRRTLRRQARSHAGRKHGSVRRSRVVLAPRPWRQADGDPSATVARKAASPGRARNKR
jgi:hypothetical protein